jgi:hypothetical protein
MQTITVTANKECGSYKTLPTELQSAISVDVWSGIEGAIADIVHDAYPFGKHDQRKSQNALIEDIWQQVWLGHVGKLDQIIIGPRKRNPSVTSGKTVLEDFVEDDLGDAVFDEVSRQVKAAYKAARRN